MPIAIEPNSIPWVEDAISAAGGVVVGPDALPEALVWTSVGKPAELLALLDAAPGIRWVQFHGAGIDAYTGLLSTIADRPITWTSAKGAYSAPVAEHALALLLAGARGLAERARAEEWGAPAAHTLYGARIVLVGAGGIVRELIRLLAPFGTENIVVRHRSEPVPGASRTVQESALSEVLATADAVVLAAALTTDTFRMIGSTELDRMPQHSILVNVGRGGLVDTDALVDALERGSIGAAALDVTDPEPLAPDHPLWRAPHALVTPHTANTPELMKPLFIRRVVENVRAYLEGSPMSGMVDPRIGY